MDFSFLSPSSPLYSFNPQTQTPQMLADRRARINALTSRIGTNPTLGGGIGDLIRGLGAGFANYRADQAQQQGNAYGTSAVDQLSNLLSQPPSPGLPAPPSNDAVGAGIKQAIATGQTPQLAVYTPPPAGVGPGNMPMPQPAPTDMTQANPIPQPMSPSVPVGPVNMATGQAAPMRSAPMPQPGTPPIMQAPQVQPTPDDSTDATDNAPVAATPAAAPMVPASNDAALIPKIMQILNNPWVSDTDKQVLTQRLAVIQSHMDPGYQLDLKTKQATLDNLTATKNSMYTDPHSGDLYTYDAADPNGTMKLVRKADPVNAASMQAPAKVKEYNFYSDQEKAAGREPMSFEQFTARAAGQGGVSKDDIQNVATAIINGDQPPDTKGLYRGGLPVKAELERQGFNLSKANQEWQAASKFISSSQGPQQLRVRQNIDALAQSLPHLQELVDQYKNGRFPALNSVMMAADYQGFTSPEQSSLVKLIRQQISDVQAQTAGVIMGSGSPTDAAFQLAHDQLQGNWSQKDITDALGNMKLNLQYRTNALRNAVPDNNRYVQAPQIAPDAPPTPVSVDPLSAARDAIAKGADPVAVKKRLQDNGIDASKL